MVLGEFSLIELVLQLLQSLEGFFLSSSTSSSQLPIDSRFRFGVVGWLCGFQKLVGSYILLELFNLFDMLLDGLVVEATYDRATKLPRNHVWPFP
jgi:hypothetical protein